VVGREVDVAEVRVVGHREPVGAAFEAGYDVLDLGTAASRALALVDHRFPGLRIEPVVQLMPSTVGTAYMNLPLFRSRTYRKPLRFDCTAALTGWPSIVVSIRIGPLLRS
jgi:hypothetical protein